MKLTRCPIPSKYFLDGKFCQLNQMFGENKSTDPNRSVFFYGPTGHNGWDIRTKGSIKYLYHNILSYIPVLREMKEIQGSIPIVAAHDGYVVSKYNNDEKEGIYVKIKDALNQEFETTYFHLSKVRVWKDDDNNTVWEQKKGRDFIKAGTVIGWAGNTGKYTTGAHLHFTLRKNGKPVDPLPYFQSKTVWKRGGLYFYKGKQITYKQALQYV